MLISSDANCRAPATRLRYLLTANRAPSRLFVFLIVGRQTFLSFADQTERLIRRSTERQTNRRTDGGLVDRQIDRHAGRHEIVLACYRPTYDHQSTTPSDRHTKTDRPIEETDRTTDRPTYRPTDRPTYRPTDRSTDRPTDRPKQERPNMCQEQKSKRSKRIIYAPLPQFLCLQTVCIV